MNEPRDPKPEAAPVWLEKATKMLDLFQGRITANDDNVHGLHLHNWLEAQILRREAEQLLALPG